MKTTHSRVHLSIPPAKAWQALTRPDLVSRWQYGSTLLTSWEVGSRIAFRVEWEGQVFEQWGTVLEFLEPVSVRYSLFVPRPGVEDRPENYFEMIYTLQPQNGGTFVTITQNDPRAESGEGAPEPSDESGNRTGSAIGRGRQSDGVGNRTGSGR